MGLAVINGEAKASMMHRETQQSKARRQLEEDSVFHDSVQNLSHAGIFRSYHSFTQEFLPETFGCRNDEQCHNVLNAALSGRNIANRGQLLLIFPLPSGAAGKLKVLTNLQIRFANS